MRELITARQTLYPLSYRHKVYIKHILIISLNLGLISNRSHFVYINIPGQELPHMVACQANIGEIVG